MVNKAIVLPSVGFYKIPITGNNESGVYKVNIRDTNISGAIMQTHYIIVEKTCIDDIQIKWLAKDGFYKFGTFNKYTNNNRKTKDGLEVPTYFTAFSDTLTRNSLITKTQQKGITLNKAQVATDTLEYYLDLACSPKVYLNIGTIAVANWVEVKVNWQPSYNANNNFHKISVNIQLPESYIQIF